MYFDGMSTRTSRLKRPLERDRCSTSLSGDGMTHQSRSMSIESAPSAVLSRARDRTSTVNDFEQDRLSYQQQWGKA